MRRCGFKGDAMKQSIPTPTLPYALDALEPHISRASLENHLLNHHARYVDRTNALLAGTEMEGMTAEEVVQRLARNKGSELFNNAAQAYNHAFLWRSMKPAGGGRPTGPIADRIDVDFGGYDAFDVAFRKAALGVFGSGWVWLVAGGAKLAIVATKDANTPLTRDLTPLLTLDVWEHAYYPDYGSRRAAFVEAFLSGLVNWDFANENLKRGRPAERTTGTAQPRPSVTAAE
jgi:Fe-Mn family superoxide dismutase